MLQLIAEANSSKEVATLMGVSLKTIESHRSSLTTKLEIHKVACLVHFAIREGLIERSFSQLAPAISPASRDRPRSPCGALAT